MFAKFEKSHKLDLQIWQTDGKLCRNNKNYEKLLIAHIIQSSDIAPRNATSSVTGEICLRTESKTTLQKTEFRRDVLLISLNFSCIFSKTDSTPNLKLQITTNWSLWNGAQSWRHDTNQSNNTRAAEFEIINTNWRRQLPDGGSSFCLPRPLQ